MTTVYPSEILEKLRLLEQLEDDLPGVAAVHDMQTLTLVHLSRRGRESIGVGREALQGMTMQDYHDRFFNPADAADYAPKIMAMMERNVDDEFVTFFQQVRAAPGRDWRWYVSSIKVFAKDAEGRPWLTLSIATPMDDAHPITAKAVRLLEENNFMRKQVARYSLLTVRERRVLREQALGKSTADIAKELFIAPATVETHRRNIRQKLEVSSSFELIQYARAFSLI